MFVDVAGMVGAGAMTVDVPAIERAWAAALRAPAWSGAAVWIHGDITLGNLLLVDDRLSAVIDFGTIGTGDPACDLVVAWKLLPVPCRPLFRAAVGVDDASWGRGRGWALSIAVVALPYYHTRNPALAANSMHVIEQVLSEKAAF